MPDGRKTLLWSGRTHTRLHIGHGAAVAYSSSSEHLTRLVVFDPNTTISIKLCRLWQDRQDSITICRSLPAQTLDSDHALATAHELATTMTADSVDVVVAIGGGSVLDIAKIAVTIASGATLMIDPGPRSGLALSGAPSRKPLPLAAIPTTLGTGSETSTVARLPLPDRKSRLLVSPASPPAVVILDSEATESLPAGVAALGAVEILLRLVGPLLGPSPCHGATVPWAVAAAQRVLSLTDDLLDSTVSNGDRAHTRLALAILSAGSHRTWGLVGRSPFAFRLWYLADAMAVVGQVTKMSALTWLFPTYLEWVLRQQDDRRWGDAHRAQYVAAHVLGCDGEPTRAAERARALLDRWSVSSSHPRYDPAEVADTALSSWRRQLAGLNRQHLTRFFAAANG